MAEGVRAWIVAFEEHARPALIRTPAGQDVTSKGLAWINPHTGRVLKTQLDSRPRRGLTTRITATYAPNERLGLWLPAEMEEVYETESRTITGERDVHELPPVRNRGEDQGGQAIRVRWASGSRLRAVR